jgi:hypothetical protein
MVLVEKRQFMTRNKLITRATLLMSPSVGMLREKYFYQYNNDTRTVISALKNPFAFVRTRMIAVSLMKD